MDTRKLFEIIVIFVANCQFTEYGVKIVLSKQNWSSTIKLNIKIFWTYQKHIRNAFQR